MDLDHSHITYCIKKNTSGPFLMPFRILNSISVLTLKGRSIVRFYRSLLLNRIKVVHCTVTFYLISFFIFYSIRAIYIYILYNIYSLTVTNLVNKSKPFSIVRCSRIIRFIYKHLIL